MAAEEYFLLPDWRRNGDAGEMKRSKFPDLGGDLTKTIIGAAMAVHRSFGPGLDEADYEQALHIELTAMGIEHECQVPLGLTYKGVKLDCGYRIDLVLPGQLLLELKVVDKLHPLHHAQLLTYLQLAQIPLGLLMNFNVLMLRDGLIRKANTVRVSPQPLTSLAPVHDFDQLSREVLASALEVQHHLGTGLLRSAYEICLAHELTGRGLKVERGLPVNLVYRDQLIASKKQIPLVVADRLLVACHCVSALGPLQLSRDRSLLRSAHIETGLSINFHAESQGPDVRRIRVNL